VKILNIIIILVLNLSNLTSSDTIYPKEILDDGIVTHGSKNIKHAWLFEETFDYDHGVFGNTIEAKSIAIILYNEKKLTFTLDDNHVFEDKKVRLFDIDRDGQDEMFVITTHLKKGATLGMYKVLGEKIVKVTDTGYLNHSYRWLNVVGFGDFDGNGVLNTALVKTPHIGGILTIYEYKENKQIQKYEKYGFTNHYMGSKELGMSTVANLNEDKIDEIIVPLFDRETIKVLNFRDGRYNEIKTMQHNSSIDSAITLKEKVISYILHNKKVIQFSYK